jgi:hypothetical protein
MFEMFEIFEKRESSKYERLSIDIITVELY